MLTAYQNLRQRAKGLYVAGLAALIVGSLPVIYGGVVISSPVGFLAANPFKTWAFFWGGLVTVGFGFMWLFTGLVTATMAVRLQPDVQVSVQQYPPPPQRYPTPPSWEHQRE